MFGVPLSPPFFVCCFRWALAQKEADAQALQEKVRRKAEAAAAAAAAADAAAAAAPASDAPKKAKLVPAAAAVDLNVANNLVQKANHKGAGAKKKQA